MNERLLSSLRRRYGDDAERVYTGLLAEGKGPFGEGGASRAEHVAWAASMGVPAIGGAVKPRRRKRR